MMGYIRRILCVAGVACALSASPLSAQLRFEGATGAAVQIDPAASTGLNDVYVLPSTVGVHAVASVAGAASAAKVYRFSTTGAAYAELIEFDTRGSSTVVFALSAGDMGYVVENAAGRSSYYWITDYAGHQYSVTAVSVNSAESDCDMLALNIEGSAPAVYFIDINGRRTEIPRDIEVEYNTLEFDEDSFAYVEKRVSHSVSHSSENGILRVAQPLCPTDIIVRGDRFLKVWGEELESSTELDKAMAVEAHSKAVVTERDAPNEKKEEGSEALGGSGPCEVTFTAAATDGAEFRQWQVARDEEFNIIDLQFNELEFTHTFTEQGYWYVRFVAADAQDICSYYGDVYPVYIGDSRLECPNAFSPGASEDVNDEWRVSYKSIVDFKCSIFNRWGVEVASFDNPAQGWDGRYKGKLVPAGVYFYVIKARGADDRRYNLSGDINVIRYKGSDAPSAPDPAPVE